MGRGRRKAAVIVSGLETWRSDLQAPESRFGDLDSAADMPTSSTAVIRVRDIPSSAGVVTYQVEPALPVGCLSRHKGLLVTVRLGRAGCRYAVTLCAA